MIGKMALVLFTHTYNLHCLGKSLSLSLLTTGIVDPASVAAMFDAALVEAAQLQKETDDDKASENTDDNSPSDSSGDESAICRAAEQCEVR